MQTNYKFSYQRGDCEMPVESTCRGIYNTQEHSRSLLASLYHLREAILWARIKVSQRGQNLREVKP